MALSRKTSEDGSHAEWFGRGQDHGKAVRARIRPVPADVNRALRRRVYGDVKSRRSGNQSVARDLELLEQFARERAVYALVDTENWGVELVDQAAVDEYAPLLKVEAKPGDEVLLDQRCTDEVKRRYLTDFPREAGWVSDKAESITQSALEEEDEATDSF